MKYLFFWINPENGNILQHKKKQEFSKTWWNFFWKGNKNFKTKIKFFEKIEISIFLSFFKKRKSWNKKIEFFENLKIVFFSFFLSSFFKKFLKNSKILEQTWYCHKKWKSFKTEKFNKILYVILFFTDSYKIEVRNSKKSLKRYIPFFCFLTCFQIFFSKQHLFPIKIGPFWGRMKKHKIKKFHTGCAEELL